MGDLSVMLVHTQPPLSLAYCLAVVALHSAVEETPLPKGLITKVVGDWEINLNNSSEVAYLDDIAPLPPYEILARSLKYVCFMSLGPYGGIIGGGMPEDEFIEAMQQLVEQAGETD